MANTSAATCPSRVRDLVGLHAGTLDVASAVRRFDAVVDEVWRARRADDLDAVEAACQQLVEFAHHPLPPLRAAPAGLEQSMALGPGNAEFCVIGCDACRDNGAGRQPDGSAVQ